MDIAEIRRRNLETVIREKFGGKKVLLADALGIESTYLSRFYAEGANRRNIGTKFARNVEIAAGLPEYWMDKDHESHDETAIAGKADIDWAKFASILEAVDKALDDEEPPLSTEIKLEIAEIFYDLNAEAPPSKAVVLRLVKRLKTA